MLRRRGYVGALPQGQALLFASAVAIIAHFLYNFPSALRNNYIQKIFSKLIGEQSWIISIHLTCNRPTYQHILAYHVQKTINHLWRRASADRKRAVLLACFLDTAFFIPPALRSLPFNFLCFSYFVGIVFACSCHVSGDFRFYFNFWAFYYSSGYCFEIFWRGEYLLGS